MAEILEESFFPQRLWGELADDVGLRVFDIGRGCQHHEVTVHVSITPRIGRMGDFGFSSFSAPHALGQTVYGHSSYEMARLGKRF